MSRFVNFAAFVVLLATGSGIAQVICWEDCRTCLGYATDGGVVTAWEDKKTGFYPVSHAPIDKMWSQNPQALPRTASTVTLIEVRPTTGTYTCPKDENGINPLPEEVNAGLKYIRTKTEYAQQKCASKY